MRIMNAIFRNYRKNNFLIVFQFFECFIIFVPNIKKAIAEKHEEIKAYVVNKDMKEITFRLGNLTDDERDIITKGCLINYYRG